MARQGKLQLVPERKVWTVSELTAQVRDLLERAFRELWVQGEVSNFRVSPYGHYYFTLKDNAAQLRCFVNRKDTRFLRLRPEDGLEVTLRGSLSVYEQRGEYQIVVNYLEPVGLGALQLAFDQLKARLQAEGLFAAARKKPLPMLPQRIGLVTSPRGAALADIIRILRRRYENLHLLLYPVRVQGEGAAEEIVEALRYFNRAKRVEVIILARGGGSLEDLWAFNEEVVARAVAASKIPILTGVGHETDFTIADFVADLRAPTPSAAAELVIKSKEEMKERLRGLETKLAQQARYRVLHARQRLTELLAARGWRRLEGIVRERAQYADELASHLRQALRELVVEARQQWAVAAARLASFDLRGAVERERLRLRALAGQLNQLSPMNVLERGYAIVFDDQGKIVKSATGVRLGDPLAIQLARGRLHAEVKKKERGEGR
ncbi:exodeoxyribonuclease VII large subunit [Acidobacteriia bacterium AH_259_A11_L15]|nr:exodeoxyribonuclease VII large subunit [Acidobacteriia bacterium AH_259_A11_L15]